ncbi:MAG: LuxR family transcriptional regulator [Bacteroidales bacterium]|nr:LuxR family transcriptional regulator [Bacteroidales bacterium]
MKLRRLFLFLPFFILTTCSPFQKKDEWAVQNAVLIEQATKDVERQNFEAAMENALQALEVSRAQGNRLQEVQALHTMVGIGIMTSRDADAWEKALEAEGIARKEGFRKELAGILISKAKLCSYAEISPETSRNDEGLQYAHEALEIAGADALKEQEAEACYVIGSLYINKNRWNDPIDKELYRKAGEYLDRGQAIADELRLDRLRRNGILFRSRWFQQGDRNAEALEYFAGVRESLDEEDHLMASSLDDRLVRLYTRTGNAEKALDTHDDYVYHINRYMQQKADETLQEMETRFEVQEKERKLERRGYQISLLLLIVLLSAAIIVIAIGYIRRVHRRNAELQRLSDTKEQIIDTISKDLSSPVSGYASRLEQLAVNPGMLNEKVAAYVEKAMQLRQRTISDIGLTERELQIIHLSVEGLSAAEIAARLFISVHTVNTHRQHIYAKMDVKNVSDMIHKAGEMGII